MPTENDIRDQQELLATWRRNLAHHLKQQAIHGSAQTRPETSHGIREARAEIARIKTILCWWGVKFEDLPDDEDQQSSIFPQSDICTLCRILGSAPLSADKFEEIYYNSIPPGPIEFWKASFPAFLIRKLAEAPIQKPGNTHPLLDYVQRIAGELAASEGYTQLLADWISKVARRLNLSNPSSPCTSSSQEVYLLVEIRPTQPLAKTTPPDQVNYYVDAWLFYSDNSYKKLIIDDNGSYRFSDIPQILTKFIQKSNSILLSRNNTYNLTIEFFLPLPLLLYEIDLWTFNAPLGTSIRLGHRHSVVVRSLDRIHPENLQYYWNEWNDKWQRFNGEITLQMTFQASCYNQCCSLTTHFLRDDIIAFILAFIPGPDMLLQDMLVATIDMGIPVALCPRPQETITEDHGQSLNEVISGCWGEHLPTYIYRIRQQATENYHAGNYLTLLWDNPQRLPPTALRVFETLET